MNEAIIPAAVELIPENYFASLDLAQIFAREAPLEVDLGCGDGGFLVALAEQFPERNFLGIERLLGRVRTVCRKAKRANLSNVRALRLELTYAVKYLLPPASADAAHLLFPDPWPKSRHRRRRIVTREFLANIHDVLKPGGKLHIATDQARYFEAIEEVLASANFVRTSATQSYPLTTFEKRFVAEGVPIHRLALVKVS